MNDTPTEPTEPAAEAPAATPDAPEAPAEPDWKAEARKWEKTAKENKNAAARLEKLEASMMSEQDKAVAKAKAEGRTEAAKEYGSQKAASAFEIAALKAGADTSGVADLISYDKFLADDGEVDTKAIEKAVKGLPKSSAPRGGGKSGGDFGGAPSTPPASLDARIREAEAKGDFKLSRQLKSERMYQGNQ